jgi:hypothetical protein
VAGHGEKLDRTKEAAIAALLARPSIKAAAAQVGVNEQTLRSWLKLPDFLAEYRAARRQLVEAALARLQKAAGKAVRTLVRNLKAAKASDQIRAACVLLEQAVKAVEVLDLSTQLEELRAELERVRNAESQGVPHGGSGGGNAAAGGPVPGGPPEPDPEGKPPPGAPAPGPCEPAGPREDAPGPLAGALPEIDFPADPPSVLPPGG